MSTAPITGSSAARLGRETRCRHVKFNNVSGDSFEQVLIWEDKAGEPMLNEVRTARFFAYADGTARC